MSGLRALLVVALVAALPVTVWPSAGDSVYLLDLDLTTQAGEPAALDLNRGRPTLVTMFYASCAHTCPLIVETLQWIERALSVDERDRIRVLMVSLDPERDSAEALRELADRHGIDETRWTLAHAPASDVRQLAAVLGVRYRVLPNAELNHSTVIALLDADGRIVATISAVGRPNEQFIRRLRDELASRVTG